ncbi:MAG: glycosyltransferase [Anaerolineae bacterium]|nr:glycosyltransferase [Anaerolineae bacterium]
MRLLFLAPQLPYPPQKGTAMRNWGLISDLVERHEVAVLSFAFPPSIPPQRGGRKGGGDDALTATCRVEIVEPPVRSLGTRLRDMLTTAKPDMALRLASDAYAQRLADWLAQETFDVMHVEGIEMAPYLDVIDAVFPSLCPPTMGGDERGGKSPRPLIVFDDHNCEYLLQKRAFLTDLRIPSRWLGAAYSFIQWQRLLDYEAQACRRADLVLAVSEADAAALRKLAPDVQVTVVPNGIDTRAYQPQISNLKSQIPKNTLVFTGTMDFRPNVDAVLWFAQEVLPRIRAQVEDVRFFAVGQRPHRRLEVLQDDPAVTLTDFVEDTRPYIANAAVYVVPLRLGGGTRFKILEALAMGKAVVSTTLGAEGFPVTHGQELLLADKPEDFAQAVVSLLNVPQKRESLGQAGRAFVEARYDWRVIVPLVEEAYGFPNL